VEFKQCALENLVMENKFWSGKRVFITGHTGFKGVWLSWMLRSLGATIAGYSLLPSEENYLYNESSLKNELTSNAGDVRDLDHLKKCMKEFDPQIAFHLAAQSLVLTSYENPVDTFSTNVMGTVNFLESLRACSKVTSAVVVTSDKCYDNTIDGVVFREDSPKGGSDPYSASKGCAELVTDAYTRSFFYKNDCDSSCAVSSVRAGNVIGGGDKSKNRLIPDILKAVSNSATIKLRNPDSIRPWQHVLDPLHGYMLLAENLFNSKKLAGEAFNFGPQNNTEKTVRWLVNGILEKLECRLQVEEVESVYVEAKTLTLDSGKASQLLGWCPKLTLDDSLNLIAEFYNLEQKKIPISEILQNQITNFQNSNPI
jgi:CDP-glucose 4,6-dehydratase